MELRRKPCWTPDASVNTPATWPDVFRAPGVVLAAPGAFKFVTDPVALRKKPCQELAESIHMPTVWPAELAADTEVDLAPDTSNVV